MQKFSWKSREEFLNEIVNEEIFSNYFRYQNPSYLVKGLFKADKRKNDNIKYLTINEFIKLMENINVKRIPEKENPKKVISIVERILNFNE